jgi:hypothetical protein
MTAYTELEILAQLDQAARDYRFPMLDSGYYYPVDQRLHAFRDSNRWAIIIEALGYNPRAGNLIDVFEKFGNCVGSSGADNDDFVGRVDNFKELWALEQDDHSWMDADGLIVRGTAIPMPPNGQVTQDQPWSLLRAVVPDHRDLFLASEAELRSRVPADLPSLSVLDEWNHPDLLGGRLPSDAEAFRLIAAALVSGDPATYAPTEPPNTHWTNWPEGGAL